MCGAIPQLPHTSSGCGAYLSTGYVFLAWYLVKHRDMFTFSFSKAETVEYFKILPQLVSEGIREWNSKYQYKGAMSLRHKFRYTPDPLDQTRVPT